MTRVDAPLVLLSVVCWNVALRSPLVNTMALPGDGKALSGLCLDAPHPACDLFTLVFDQFYTDFPPLSLQASCGEPVQIHSFIFS